jgi:hypothetical protein
MQQEVTMDLSQKRLSKKMPPFFDEVFYYSIFNDNEGNKQRYLATSNDVINFAKDRSGKLGRFEKPNLEDINNKILGVKNG